MAGKLEEYRRKRQFNRTPEPPGVLEEEASPSGKQKAATASKSGKAKPTGADKPDKAGQPTVGKPAKAGGRLPSPKLAILEGKPTPGLAGENVFVVQKH